MRNLKLSLALLLCTNLLFLGACGAGSGGLAGREPAGDGIDGLTTDNLAGGGANGWAVVWSIPTSGEVQITPTGMSDNPFAYVAMSVGDNSINQSVRTVLQFDISGLNMEAADEVHLYVRTNPPAGDPFGQLGGIYVDHLLGEGGLVQEMHGGFTLDPMFAHLPTEQESYSIDVTAQVHADLLAGRTTSTFRFRTVIPTDTNEDYDQWRIYSSQNDWPGFKPALQITEYQ